MISIVACCHGAKLCAYAARDFRSQQGTTSRPDNRITFLPKNLNVKECEGEPNLNSHKKQTTVCLNSSSNLANESSQMSDQLDFCCKIDFASMNDMSFLM